MEPPDYQRFPEFWEDAALRKWNLWGYVDVRDVSQSVRRAIEAPLDGADVFIIAAADNVMTRDSADLMAEVYPDVPLRRDVKGRETLLAIDHAREALGYEPEHGWEEHLS
jgi:nucleoside-diphosphate-sugar epimerase